MVNGYLVYRGLTKTMFLEARRAARLCKRGDAVHGPVNLLAKLWCLEQLKA